MTYPPQPQAFGHPAHPTPLPQATPAAPGAPTAPTTPAASAPMRVVEARGLTKVYGEGEARVVALDSASLVVGRGEFVAIMGPSGSGKSTLLHCLAGLDTPTSGSVLIAGQDLSGMKDKQLTAVRRDRLGFIFQSFNLLPTLSAEENILLPQRLAHRKPQRDWYDAVISTLGIGDRLSHRPHELSGGQQQRVAVARALVDRPEVVFADEPTGALDTASAAALLETLASMCEHLGQTVVMVTHDEQAAATTNRIIRLRDGHITGDQPNHHNDSPLVVGGIYDIPDGFAVPLTGPAGSVELTARVQEGWGAAVSPAVAQRLNGDAPTNATMCVRSTGSTMTAETEREPIAAIRGQPLMVDGSVAATEQMSSIITRLPLNRLPGSGRHPGHRPVRAGQHHGCLGSQADQGDRGSACRRQLPPGNPTSHRHRGDPRGGGWRWAGTRHQLHPQDDRNPRDSWPDGGDDRHHPPPTSRFSTPLPRLWPSVCLPHCVRQGGPPRHHRSRLSLRTDRATRTIGDASAPAISLLHTYTNLT